MVLIYRNDGSGNTNENDSHLPEGENGDTNENDSHLLAS